jgi:hypothetical protein
VKYAIEGGRDGCTVTQEFPPIFQRAIRGHQNAGAH